MVIPLIMLTALIMIIHKLDALALVFEAESYMATFLALVFGGCDLGLVNTG